jgi:hypothetical protein
MPSSLDPSGCGDQMDDILESLTTRRNSVSRETTTYVEGSGRLVFQKSQACLREAGSPFRVRELPLTRCRLDALPSEKAGIDRP